MMKESTNSFPEVNRHLLFDSASLKPHELTPFNKNQRTFDSSLADKFLPPNNNYNSENANNKVGKDNNNINLIKNINSNNKENFTPVRDPNKSINQELISTTKRHQDQDQLPFSVIQNSQVLQYQQIPGVINAQSFFQDKKDLSQIKQYLDDKKYKDAAFLEDGEVITSNSGSDNKKENQQIPLNIIKKGIRKRGIGFKKMSQHQKNQFKKNRKYFGKSGYIKNNHKQQNQHQQQYINRKIKQNFKQQRNQNQQEAQSIPQQVQQQQPQQQIQLNDEFIQPVPKPRLFNLHHNLNKMAYTKKKDMADEINRQQQKNMNIDSDQNKIEIEKLDDEAFQGHEQDILQVVNEQIDQNKIKEKKHIIKFTGFQCNKICEYWKKNNFIDFNLWVQRSKSKIEINFTEIIIAGKVKFTCSIKLYLPKETKIQGLMANGQGATKKEAKGNSLERLLIEILNAGVFYQGIRDERYVEHILNDGNLIVENEENNQEYQQKQKMNEDKIIKGRVGKLRKKLKRDIKMHDIHQACQKLAQLVNYGQADWKDICEIWYYSVQNRKINCITTIIDIVQNKSYTKEMEQNLKSPLISKIFKKLEVCQANSLQDDYSVQEYLQEKFGFIRQPSNNPFDIFDKFNLLKHNAEIPQGISKMTSEEFSAIQTKQAALSDIDSCLIEAQEFPIKQTRPIYNNYGYLAHPIEYEQAQKQHLAQFIRNQNLQPYTNLYFNQRDSEPNELLPKDQSGFKDPFINYLSPSILDEMYSSLLLCEDQRFALQASELIYNRVKLDPSAFQVAHSLNFYSNRRLQLAQEAIETSNQHIRMPSKFLSIQQKHLQMQHQQHFSLNNHFIQQEQGKKQLNEKDQPSSLKQDLPQLTSKQYAELKSITSIRGCAQKIGKNFGLDVVLFTPQEMPVDLEVKLLKRSQISGAEAHTQISEDELVLVTSFFQPTAEHPTLDDSKLSTLAHLLNHLTDTLPYQDAAPLIASVTDFGFKVEFAFCALVKEIMQNFSLKLYLLHARNQSKAIKQHQRQWKITKICNINTYFRQCEALKRACSSISMSHRLFKVIVAPPSTNPIYVSSIAQTQVENDYDSKSLALQVNQYLTENQYQTVLAGTRQLLTIIQAPPSTGKTRVLIKIIQQWQGQNGLKILICADCNETVNYLYLLFKQHGLTDVLKMTEGQTDKLEFTGFKIPQFSHHKQNSINFLKRCLSQCKLVVVNCHAANYSLLKSVPFTKVIIYNAQNINELSCIEALAKNCQQCVMFGDQMQIPIIKSNSLFAASRGYSQSLFERLIKQGLRPHLLEQQYNVNPELHSIASRLFYKSRLSLENKHILEEGQVCEENNSQTFEMNCNKSIKNTSSIFNQPSSFIHVNSCEQIAEGSLINQQEVYVVVTIVANILKNNILNPEDITIITMFKAQQRKISNELQYFGMNNPAINNTINKIQIVRFDKYAAQRKCVIFSAVRANKEQKLGLLSDPRVINQIINLSTDQLIVVGDLLLLDNDSIWKELIIDAKNKNKIWYFNRQGIQ